MSIHPNNNIDKMMSVFLPFLHLSIGTPETGNLINIVKYRRLGSEMFLGVTLNIRHCPNKRPYVPTSSSVRFSKPSSARQTPT